MQITFKNDQIVDASIDASTITYNDHILSINSKEPITLSIEYDITENTSITYKIGRNSDVKLIEVKKLNNAKLYKEVYVEENAILHTFVNNDAINTNEHEEVYHIETNASFTTGYAELSDESLKANYQYHLDGEGSACYVRMAILSSSDEKKKYNVSITHHKPHTTGIMDNYGVVKEKGQLVIDGVGTITKGQHGSESHQTNKIMVFDKDCVASANPYLFIDEYDVKASHAAGVGKMDEEHLYYLESRGLTKKQSMQLITYGYLKPVLEVIDDETLRSQFEHVLNKVGESNV